MWETVSLSDVCKINNGGTPKSKEKPYWGDEWQWLTPKDMGKLEGRYVSQTERQITQLGLDNSSAKLVPENSVILSCRAPIGHVAINKVPMSFNQGCKGLVPTSDVITEYLYYFLLSSKSLLNSLGTGATFKEISSKTLSKVKISLPPFAEQQRIVEKLDATFAEIDGAINAIDKQLKHVNALRNTIISKIIKHTGSEEAVMWETVNLGDVCELKNGFAFKSKLFKTEGHPIIRISNIQNGCLAVDNMVFFNEEDYQIRINRYEIKPGALLIAMSGATTGKLGFNTTNETFYLNQRVGNLVPSADLDIKYLYYLLSTKVEENLAISKGAAQPNLSSEQIRNIAFDMPPLAEQQRIVEKLDATFAETDKLVALYNNKRASFAALQSAILSQELESKAA